MGDENDDAESDGEFEKEGVIVRNFDSADVTAMRHGMALF